MTELQFKTIEAYNKNAKSFANKIGKLKNYDHTYDAFLDMLNEGDNVLDLACGPGQIAKYISDRKAVNITGVDLSENMLEIAYEAMPTGRFYKDSIITFKGPIAYQAIIIGFGIPYLTIDQIDDCIKNALSNLQANKHIYISFMNGNCSRIEKTSFGGDYEFNIHYHQKKDIIRILEKYNSKVIKEFSIEYKEADGSSSEDIVLISRKCT